MEVERREVSVRGPTSPLILVYGFIGIILIGTLLLMFPAATEGGVSGGFGDQLTTALFTATSATAVTGLVVVDTADHWTTFGHLVIMVLFFIGGLGFMTGAAFLLMVVGQRIGLQGQLMIGAGLGEQRLGVITSLVRKIVFFAVVVQVGGIVLLFLRWYVFGELWEGISLADALWQSTFHSLSSFNNAGFDIIPDEVVGGGSLQPFGTDIPLLLITAVLIVIGGISYFVVADVLSQRNFRRLRVDTKLVLVGSLILFLIGATIFLTTEWSRTETIGSASVTEKMASAVLHSTTTRSAGLSSVDYAQIDSANNVATQALMFIGGASASAAGGIRVNTFMVTIIAVVATLRGRRRINAFDRELPEVIIRRALVIGAAATGLLVASFVAFVAIQPGFTFREALFEVISAVGNVGLTTGITSELNSGTRILLTIVMFGGRFGPLTLALMMAGRQPTETYQLTNERVRIG